jgi:aldehyde:ferredoxin oxidoreductase
MSLSNGYAGKILNVNLTSHKITEEPLDMTLARKFLGGMGLAAKILFDEVGPEIDALSPHNLVIFSVGPLAGTAAPSSGRTEVTTKSSLTGTFGSGNAGGYWAAALKSAGYDAVIFRGESSDPVYLYIDDHKTDLLDASFIHGKDACETAALIRESQGENTHKIRVASIGPAGENLVKFASLTFDCFHAAGRCGAGAVMGAKKLKAVAVRLGDKIVTTSTESLNANRHALTRMMTENRRMRSRSGSMFTFPGFEREGSFPCKNYRYGSLSHLTAKDVESALDCVISAPSEVMGCYNCPIQCKHMIEVKSGKYSGLKMSSGTFVNTLLSWTKAGVENVEAAWKFKDVCQRLGLDQASASGVIAFAMELYEKGLVNKSDVDGLQLDWGDEEAILELLSRIAYRKGFGNILAEGSAKASRMIGKGAERYAMTIKGMELLGGDVRASSRLWYFGQATSPRGDYMKSTHVHADSPPASETLEKYGGIAQYSRQFVERLDIPEDLKRAMYGNPPLMDKYTYQGKPLLTKWYEDLFSVINSLSTCIFPAIDLGPTYYSEMLSACTGWDMSPQEIMLAGERVFNLTKLYGMREGFGRRNDYHPRRFYEEPLQNGPSKGAILSLQEFNTALDQYYEARGWDRSTGTPTRKKLIELGLSNEGVEAGITPANGIL